MTTDWQELSRSKERLLFGTLPYVVFILLQWQLPIFPSLHCWMQAQTDSSLFPGLAWLIPEIKKNKSFCSLRKKLCSTGEVKRESGRRQGDKDKEKEDSFQQRRGRRKWRQTGAGIPPQKVNDLKQTVRENWKWNTWEIRCKCHKPVYVFGSGDCCSRTDSPEAKAESENGKMNCLPDRIRIRKVDIKWK